MYIIVLRLTLSKTVKIRMTWETDCVADAQCQGTAGTQE